MIVAALLLLPAAGSLSEARAAKAGSPPPAPVGHRQPTAQDVPRQDTSADDAMKKMDEDLDRKLKSICRGC